MNNQIKIIREKLSLSDKILDKPFLDKLLDKFGSNYKIKDLLTLKLISSIKRGESYLNNMNNDLENPYDLIKTYFKWETYMLWGIGVYNMYWFSTQVAEWYVVYNKKIATQKVIWRSKIIFYKQKDSFFYWSVINKNGTNRYNIMSPERAFIQVLKEDKPFSKIPNNVDAQKLLNMAKKYATKTIVSKIEKLCI